MRFPVHRLVRKRLRQTALYRHLQYSSGLYKVYLRLTNPDALAAYKAEKSFYSRLLAGLTPSDLIFDIGANRGYKTAFFLDLGARVVAVDPDPANVELLRWRFKGRSLEVVQKAVSDRATLADFYVLNDANAKNTLSEKWKKVLEESGSSRFGKPHQFEKTYSVETITLDELMSEYGVPFFVKVDVEGLELEVFRGLNTKVPLIQFEVNLPQFRTEGLESISRLNRLDPEARFNYSLGTELSLQEHHWLSAQDLSGFFHSHGLGSEERAIEVFVRMESSGQFC